ncbi:SDR family NAD(P)-dependent oxidoreductase [Micromonospora rubida]|uniref:SDR family NAD(P)-dependent oxidoreductase n=1 Tax=Micromonospora rubida TaxID=2697657 RepID=UPI002E2C7E68|nr:SDR family NAD(P)-dependent oxidoreductase [Micromonospora rubida]
MALGSRRVQTSRLGRRAGGVSPRCGAASALVPCPRCSFEGTGVRPFGGRRVCCTDSAEGRLDVLVNNAGILGAGAIDGPTALRVFDTNAVGIVRVTEAALPLLRKSSNPTVVTLSSSLGSFWAVNNPDRPEFNMPLALYAASKSAATMLTVQYAKSQPGIKFNAVEPGATATDMTAAFGIGRSVVESAKTVVRLATLGADGPTGTFTDELGELNW